MKNNSHQKQFDQKKGLLLWNRRSIVLFYAISIVVYFFLLLFIDMPLLKWQISHALSPDTRDALNNSIAWLSPSRMIWIASGLWIVHFILSQLKSLKNHAWPCIIVGRLYEIYQPKHILILIGCVEGLKYLLGRYRPIAYIDQHLFGFSWLEWQNTAHSAPSGHAAMAWYLAFKTQHKIAWILATVISLMRVLTFRHYISDVWFAMALSWTICMMGSYLSRVSHQKIV